MKSSIDFQNIHILVQAKVTLPNSLQKLSIVNQSFTWPYRGNSMLGSEQVIECIILTFNSLSHCHLLSPDGHHHIAISQKNPIHLCCIIRNKATLSDGQFHYHFIWHFLVIFSPIYSQSITLLIPSTTHVTHIVRATTPSLNAYIGAYTSRVHPELNASQVKPSWE